MKKIRIFSFVILLITIFISLDLLTNFLSSLIPTMNDGISTHSMIPGNLYFGDGTWSQERFLNAFLISMWIAFLAFTWNIAIIIVAIHKKK